MGKYKTLFLGFVLGIAATIVIQHSSAIAPTEAHAEPLPATPGKYQISTAADNGLIFSTILNTETGKIVKRLKYKFKQF